MMISGTLAGMAEDQADRADYKGAEWRIRYAIKWAPDGYALTGAHITNARIAYMLGKHEEAKSSFEYVQKMLKTYPEYRELGEFKSALEKMQKALDCAIS